MQFSQVFSPNLIIPWENTVRFKQSLRNVSDLFLTTRIFTISWTDVEFWVIIKYHFTPEKSLFNPNRLFLFFLSDSKCFSLAFSLIVHYKTQVKAL